MLLKQSTARNRNVLMIDSTDHVTGKTGLTLTITASKDSGSFASITPTVTELTNGWYQLALTTAHTDTLGGFEMHVTGTGADPTDTQDQVVLDLPGATVSDVVAVVDANLAAVDGDSAVPAVFKTALQSEYLGTIDGATSVSTLIDSGLTQTLPDHWAGRILIFTSGDLARMATEITGFTPATDTLTFVALPTAPDLGDTYIIV